MEPICRKAHLADDSAKKVLILLNFGLDIMGRIMNIGLIEKTIHLCGNTMAL